MSIHEVILSEQELSELSLISQTDSSQSLASEFLPDSPSDWKGSFSSSSGDGSEIRTLVPE